MKIHLNEATLLPMIQPNLRSGFETVMHDAKSKSPLLYAILDTSYFDGRDPSTLALEMVRGGVDLIQIRAKNLPSREVADLSRRILPIARSSGVPLIINDHPQVAAEVAADGVHLGQDDLPISEARKILGKEKFIGKSTHSLEQALQAEKEGVDYIGLGPIFATPTKPDYIPVGLDLVRQVSKHIKIPFFGIGGVKLENITNILNAGARHVVVVSGILQSPDISTYCRSLRTAMEKAVEC